VFYATKWVSRAYRVHQGKKKREDDDAAMHLPGGKNKAKGQQALVRKSCKVSRMLSHNECRDATENAKRSFVRTGREGG